MLDHGASQPAPPARTVIIGCGGVLGRAITESLEEDGTAILGLGSKDVDLAAPGAGEKLAGLLQEGDAVVMLAALTPDKGRDIATFMANLRMAEAVCEAVQAVPVAHVVYMSSDAVYPMTEGLVSEDTPASPPDLYGTMHYAREVMFADSVKEAPLAILRSTLVLSVRDTHNSYGPNRFRRLAAENGEITLGGEGEETRDHISDADVAEVTRLALVHRSAGLVNVATGVSHSFREVADIVAGCFEPAARVKGSPRGAPVTHRHFDVTALRRAFPGLSLTPLADAIQAVHEEAPEGG